MTPAASRLILIVACAILTTACAFQKVQETTLKNASGGTTTCTQSGTGLISSGVGQKRYQACIDKAHADGYQ